MMYRLNTKNVKNNATSTSIYQRLNRFKCIDKIKNGG